MSEREPDEPYVYQPYGIQDKFHWQAGRIYGIGGLSLLTTIKGLTKDEANLILAIYRAHFVNKEPEAEEAQNG